MTIIETQQLKTIITYCHQKMDGEHSGHGFDHLARVAKLAAKINHSVHADEFLVLASAYLHDVVDEKITANPEGTWLEIAQILAANKVSAQKQAEIHANITQMSFAHTLKERPQLPLSGQVVRDADWLDALGAMGIGRAFYYGGKYGETIYDPDVKPRTHMSYEEYRNLNNETVINHFSEKLFRLASMLNTPAAKELAAPRVAFMHQFIDEFKQEWRAD